MQSFFMQTKKTLIRLHSCAGGFQSSLGAHVRRYIFSCCGSYCSGITWEAVANRAQLFKASLA